jgi:hypothetical protein
MNQQSVAALLTTSTMVQKRINDFDDFSFPGKLRLLLEEAEKVGFGDIVSWQPGGESFKVKQPERFEKEVLRSYFNQTKYKSFQRQLNIYGFRRIHQGPKKGGYAHRYFNRDELELINLVVRQSIGRNKSPFSSTEEMEASQGRVVARKRKSSFASGIDAYNPVCLHQRFTPIPYLEEPSQVPSTSLSSFDFNAFFHTPEDAGDIGAFSSSIFDDVKVDDFGPKAPTVHQDKSLNNAAADAADSEMDALISLLSDGQQRDKAAEQEQEHIFPWKLHNMLDNAEQESFQHIVSWVKDGAAFKVHNADEFLEKIMPNYFDQTKYESFRRQLNLYGFVRVNRGDDRGIISHPCFSKGDRSLCQNITRKGGAQQRPSSCSST